MSDNHSNHTIHSINHHFGWDNSNEPILYIKSGETIEIETIDSSGKQLNINITRKFAFQIRQKTHQVFS